MSTDSLNKFDYKAGGYVQITGTEDWVEVADLGEGGYSWCEFKAFYSPNARRYFWHGDSGCSCNSWNDDLNTAADFEDGDRAALLRAWEAFAKEHDYYVHVSEYIPGVNTIRNFKESK